jgi:hypothetical protein
MSMCIFYFSYLAGRYIAISLIIFILGDAAVKRNIASSLFCCNFRNFIGWAVKRPREAIYWPKVQLLYMQLGLTTLYIDPFDLNLCGALGLKWSITAESFSWSFFGALSLNLKCDSSCGCFCIVLWTSERMNASGWPYHAHCYFCYQVLGSDAHMFLGCPFPKSVWLLFGISYPQIVPIAGNSNYIC